MEQFILDFENIKKWKGKKMKGSRYNLCPIQFVPDTVCSRYNLFPIQFVSDTNCADTNCADTICADTICSRYNLCRYNLYMNPPVGT